MQFKKMEQDLEFSGERVVPGKTPPFLVLEHLIRYRFAARFSSGRKILDIGCGAGYGTSILAETAALVVGIDNAPEAILFAQESYCRPNLHFAVSDSRALAFRDQSFDLAVMFEVIEHIPEQHQALREIRRVLTPDGTLILSTPNIARPTRGIEEPNPYHARELSGDELRELLRPHFAQVQLLYQHELSGSGIQSAAAPTPGPTEVLDLSAHSAAKYFVAVCSARPAEAPVERVLGVGGIDHQIAIAQDLRQTQQDVEALLRQREENERAYAESLAAHRRDLDAKQEAIEALLHQREENERTYAENLTAHREVIQNLEQRLQELANQNAARQMELEWLHRWIPANKLARKLFYGKNLRRRILAKLGMGS
jgi:SAM-dependent methyltransferase